MPWIRIVLLYLALFLACTVPRLPQSTSSAPQTASPHDDDPVLAGLGEPTFRRYCASCHGIDARGHGPVARSLQTPPPNLRRIAQRHGGAFPGGEIARTIDGRFEIGSHGPREMPVWGQVFGADFPDVGMGESIARGQVAVLVEYLKSIQDPPDAPAHPEEIQQTMGDIFEAMRVLLPLSLSAGDFEAPANERIVSGALDMLDRSTAQLEQHGASGDVGFAHLARSLSIDARDIRLRHDARYSREARYLVQNLTETCVACHSRLPAASAPLSEAFVRDIAVVALPLEQRAKLAYATRQFDVALDQYEVLLASYEISASDLDLGGHVDDYLELAIRVQRDLPRAASALEEFARRDDLSPVLRQEVPSWIAALSHLTSGEGPDSPIAAARALVTSGEAQIKSDRHALVEHFEASGLLHRALEGELPREERAEAYYLLGRIETRIGRSWLSEAEAYLETAIRLAPGEPIAADAYQLLDEYLVAGYSGSGGTHVPPDIRTKLDRLRQIAESPPEA